MAETESSAAAVSNPSKELSLIQRIAYWIEEKGGLDRLLLRKRAVDVLEGAKVLDYFKEGGTYLDIGSGLGQIVERAVAEFKGKKIKYLALDPVLKPDRNVIKRLRDSEEQVLFMKALGERLPIKDKSIDGVSLFFVLHHIPTEAQATIFSEIKRVLKDDGKLFLVEDTPETPEEFERNIHWDRRANFEPKSVGHYYKNPTEWAGYLTGMGFNIVDTAKFESVSSMRKEGVIKHTSFICERAKGDLPVVKASGVLPGIT